MRIPEAETASSVGTCSATPVDFKAVIRSLVEDGCDLSREQSRTIVSAILDVRLGNVETAAILVALARKGETADEIAGAVDAILALRPPFSLGAITALNIGGTGGDHAGTFNISTTASFVVAAAGVPVVKHGNRSATSACGSSDVIAALGVDIAKSGDADQMRADLHACNFAFVATSAYYRFPATLTELRRRIGVRTIFNLAGPLVHPADVRLQLIGVARRSLMAPMVGAVAKLGDVAAFVVHGVDGLDEVSCVGETLINIVRDGTVEALTVRPKDFDVEPCRMSDLKGGDAQRNAEICREVLQGRPGPFRDATVVAASAALVLAGRSASFKDAASICRLAIDSGRAHRVLETFKEANK